MQVRTVIAIAAGLLAVSLIGFIVLKPRQGAQQAPRPPFQTGPGLVTPAMPPAVVPDASIISRYTASAGQARLVANLADAIGDVIVSVRQVYASDRVRNLFDDPREAGPIGTWQLVLQTNVRQRNGLQAGVNDVDISDVVATDDRGRQMRTTEPSSVLGGSSPLPGGRSHSVFMSPPDPAAALITSVAGKVRPMGTPPETATQRFLISNVPLPGSRRLFGEITPMLLSDRTIAVSPPGPLYGEAMEHALRGAVAHPDASDLPYLRLVLPEGVASTVRAGLSPESPRLTIAAKPEGEGHMAVSGLIGDRKWKAFVWDREPFILVLASGRKDRKIGVKISLSRTDETLAIPSARSLFASESRMPAGSIVVRFAVRDRPIGPAVVPVSVSKREGRSWSDPVTSEVPVRANGEAILSNLSPGAYRVQFHPERLAPLGVGGNVTLSHYLAERYRAISGRWNDAGSQLIEVLPAGRTYGRTIRYIPGEQP